ncbi:DUF881 domain-containing protein [Isoptericola dokdonensis]|uniref:DUF881 domain-containing protein n=1 Tax=Isoptericola dokdonensis TaxID=372663 RepID=UPI001E3F152D|nr:DUF881 domain-containing protein [Isoptericola dokdonensis]
MSVRGDGQGTPDEPQVPVEQDVSVDEGAPVEAQVPAGPEVPVGPEAVPASGDVPESADVVRGPEVPVAAEPDVPAEPAGGREPVVSFDELVAPGAETPDRAPEGGAADRASASSADDDAHVPGREAVADVDEGDVEEAPAAREPRATGWAAVGRALSLKPTRSQGLAALLCGLLGFALVVQVQQSAQDPLSSARQDDLVRLLDEVTQRSERLADEVDDLTRTRDELASGTGQAQAALDLAEERAASEGILSGRLPAVGPGIEIVVRDGQGVLDAPKLFNVLEELRNAGAEVVELNGVRLVTSTWFLDGDDGIVVDGVTLEAPYRWTVIGDPATLNPALEIPGGALATLRTAGAEARTVEHDEVEVTAVREPAEPQYATPSEPGE